MLRAGMRLNLSVRLPPCFSPHMAKTGLRVQSGQFADIKCNGYFLRRELSTNLIRNKKIKL